MSVVSPKKFDEARAQRDFKDKLSVIFAEPLNIGANRCMGTMESLKAQMSYGRNPNNIEVPAEKFWLFMKLCLTYVSVDEKERQYIDGLCDPFIMRNRGFGLKGQNITIPHEEATDIVSAIDKTSYFLRMYIYQ